MTVTYWPIQPLTAACVRVYGFTNPTITVDGGQTAVCLTKLPTKTKTKLNVQTLS